MLASFKSEVRKILSLRSTYVILLIITALVVLFAFYVPGWHTTPEEFMNSTYLKSQVVSAVGVLGLFAAIVAILSVTHEYRYNTIMHTLTANRSRTQVFLAKLLTLVIFAVVSTIFFGVMSPLLTVLAANMKGFEVGVQTFDYDTLVWRMLLGGLAYVMYGFIFAMIIRVQVGAIVGFFLTFTMLENLLSLVLKTNIVYLPFQSLNMLLGIGPSDLGMKLGQNEAALVVGGYIVGGLIISWLLFLRRDAS